MIGHCCALLLTDQNEISLFTCLHQNRYKTAISRAWRWVRVIVRVLARQLMCASLVRATTPGCFCCLRIDTQFSAVGAAKNSHPSFCPPFSRTVGAVQTFCLVRVWGSAKANPLPFSAAPLCFCRVVLRRSSYPAADIARWKSQGPVP